MLTSIYADHIDALPPPQRPAAHVRCCHHRGGLTGVTAALHLAEHGYDVVLLEAETIGSGGRGAMAVIYAKAGQMIFIISAIN